MHLHLRQTSHLWPQWTCQIFNAYHRKRDANLFENVRFLIRYWYELPVVYIIALLHYCWPKKCYVYYPHYSNYFLIVHPVFSCLTARKINDWKVSNLRLSFVLPCDRCGYDCIPYRHQKPRYLAPVPKRPNPLTGGFSLLHIEWVDKQWIVQNFFTFNLVLLHACDNLLPVASPKNELF